MTDTAPATPPPAPVHRFAIAAVASAGTAAVNTHGIASKKRPNDSDEGKYLLTYGNAFSAAPAVVLLSASGEQTHVRVNPESSTSEAYRTGSAWADAFRLQFPATKDVVHDNAAFAAIVAASGGAGAGKLRLNGDDTTELLVVAGVIDGADNYREIVNYGGYNFRRNSSEEGKYFIEFPAGGFAETPVVVATPWAKERSDNTIRTLDIGAVSKTEVRIDLRDDDGKRVEGKFHFLAVGKAAAGKASGDGHLITGVVHRDGDRILAGSGFSVDLAPAPATYKIDLDNGFHFPKGKEPVVVACSEHVSTIHVRQAQVHAVGTGSFKIDSYGYEDQGKKGIQEGFNNATMHFIAYAPA